jgi:hypothetical protein
MTVLLDITEGTILSLGGTDGKGTMEPTSVGSSLAVGTPSAAFVASPDGIDAEGPGTGSPSLQATIQAIGVASGTQLGDPTLNASMSLTGIPGAIQFGHPEAFTSMNPLGIDAEGGGPGNPTIAITVGPDGVASTIQFGSPDTIKTIFVNPIGAPVGNRFGDTQILMKRLIFRPPTQTLGWGWYKRFEGISLIKKDGVWQEIPWPTVQETLEADIYLPGGRDHAVSTTLAAELIAEGYSISEEF